MSEQLPERKRILEYLELLEQHGGSPDSSGEITVLRAYASGRLVLAEPTATNCIVHGEVMRVGDTHCELQDLSPDPFDRVPPSECIMVDVVRIEGEPA